MQRLPHCILATPLNLRMKAVHAALLSGAPAARGKMNPSLFFNHQRASMLQSAAFCSALGRPAGVMHFSKFHVQR